MPAATSPGSLRNPAHYSCVYGHKPTWGLISTRGHAPPGIMTPTDISVVGPMARHAEDLDLALRALAGPDLRSMSLAGHPAGTGRGYRAALRRANPPGAAARADALVRENAGRRCDRGLGGWRLWRVAALKP